MPETNIKDYQSSQASCECPIGPPLKIGLYGTVYEGFADNLRDEGYEPITIKHNAASWPNNLSAAVVDLNEPEASNLIERFSSQTPQTPKILIAPQDKTVTDDIDSDAFALVYRPFTPIELIDIVRWACDIRGTTIPGAESKRQQLNVLLGKTAQELFYDARWLTAIFNQLPLGLLFVSPDGNVIRANDNVLKTFGFDGEIVGKPCNNIVPWRDIEDTICRIDECVETRDVLSNIFEIPDDHHLEVIHVPVETKSQLIGVLIVIRDISYESPITNHFQTVAEVLDDGIAIIDQNMKMIWANEVLKNWFGIEQDYFDKPCYATIENSDKVCQGCNIKNTLTDGVTHRCFQKLKLPNGVERTFEMITGPVRNRRGKIVRAVRIVRDVTDREKVIQVLAETKERLEDANIQLSRRIDELAMLMELSDALQGVESLEENLHIFLTAVTARQGCGFNRAFLFLVNHETNILEGTYALGPSSPDEASRIWSELETRPASFSEALTNYRKVLEGGDVEVNRIIRELKYGLSNQEAILVKVLNSKVTRIVYDASNDPNAAELAGRLHSNTFAIVPLLAMTKPVGVLVVDNMVTNAPINEQSLRILKTISAHASLAIERGILTAQLAEQYEKLQATYKKLRDNQELLLRTEKLSAIGKLAAQVAHEIRNPLVSIGGFARNILKLSEPESKIHRFSNIIVEETQRLEGIVEDILSFSDNHRPQLVEKELNELITTTLELIEEQVKESNIEVITNLDPKVGKIPLGPDQIRQVFLNLFKNSIAAMPDGGTLTVTTRHAGGFIWIDVTDSGTGIPDDVRDRVFEPFFTTKSSGTGLGLSVSYQIIETHGGMIWFTTTKDKGTTFHIKLPTKGRNE